MSLPAIGFREPPKDIREWDRVFFDINYAVRKNGTRTFARNQTFLNQISSANKQSTQSAQPLTSTDSGGGLAQIAISAHNVQYAFGTVAFGSGTITGLLNATLYYVYAQDENYQGGALTYLASTNPNVVTSSENRYYLGKITTAAGGGGSTNGGYGGGGGGNGSPIP